MLFRARDLFITSKFLFILIVKMNRTNQTAKLSLQQSIIRFGKITELIEAQPTFAYVKYFEQICLNTIKYSNQFLDQIIGSFKYGVALAEHFSELYEEFYHEYERAYKKWFESHGTQQQEYYTQDYSLAQYQPIIYGKGNLHLYSQQASQYGQQPVYGQQLEYLPICFQSYPKSLQKKADTIEQQKERKQNKIEIDRKMIRNILDSIVPENLKPREPDLLKYLLYSEGACKVMAEEIVKKVQQQPQYASIYATLCSNICKKLPSDFKFERTKKEKQNPFKIFLIEAVQMIYDIKVEKLPQFKSLEEKELFYKQAKKKIMGKVTFISYLILSTILKKRTIKHCISQIIQSFLKDYYDFLSNNLIQGRIYHFHYEAVICLIDNIGEKYDDLQEKKKYNQVYNYEDIKFHIQTILDLSNPPNLAILDKLIHLSGDQYVGILELLNSKLIVSKFPRLSLLLQNLIQRRQSKWQKKQAFDQQKIQALCQQLQKIKQQNETLKIQIKTAERRIKQQSTSTGLVVNKSPDKLENNQQIAALTQTLSQKQKELNNILSQKLKIQRRLNLQLQQIKGYLTQNHAQKQRLQQNNVILQKLCADRQLNLKQANKKVTDLFSTIKDLNTELQAHKAKIQEISSSSKRQIKELLLINSNLSEFNRAAQANLQRQKTQKLDKILKLQKKINTMTLKNQKLLTTQQESFKQVKDLQAKIHYLESEKVSLQKQLNDSFETQIKLQTCLKALQQKNIEQQQIIVKQKNDHYQFIKQLEERIRISEAINNEKEAKEKQLQESLCSSFNETDMIKIKFQSQLKIDNMNSKMMQLTKKNKDLQLKVIRLEKVNKILVSEKETMMHKNELLEFELKEEKSKESSDKIFQSDGSIFLI